VHICKTEQHQDADKQALALEARKIGGQKRTKGGDGERKQRHQQPCLRDRDIQVAGNGWQKTDDDEFCGQHGKPGS